uniref:Protein kinase domain-containing protein n=1 Tax=Compsopogon caeruleus TaxID=31354 RepID=A0A7S1T976_9RHOD|mmetsp:Transcript_13079/g.26547  ORF Transcript_13079/g.26547 Transcript_13079/m.26547 type:complete len:383 (+) Transcript_13079:813-1961(+)
MYYPGELNEPLRGVDWSRQFNRGIEPRTMLANKLLGRFLKKAKEDSREREQIQLGLLRMWESGTCAVIERDYVCETFLGAGAFGEVFLGFRKADRTPVAIKRYFNLSNKSEGFDFSIEKEFEYASLGLSHPCLVKTLAAVRNHDGVALVLELMGGGSLQDRLRHRPFLSEDDVKLVMRRVLEGLAHLHRNFVIHRDIKPDNIMFDSDLKLNAKIADFGLCSIGSNSTQLASGMYGTPLYVAPEVIRSSESYSSAVDLWSSGVMMYELLCGSHPFWARNTRAVARRILKGKAKFSEARWVSVSNHARALVRALLTVDPHERPTAERALAHAWFQSSANHSLKGKFRLARSGSEKLRCEKSDQNEVDLKSALQTVETVQDSLLV